MNLNILLLIIFAAIGTYLPRLLPILALKNATLPNWFQKWMGFLPISIFASLIASDLFFWEDQFNVELLTNLKLLPSILAFFVAYKTKNMISSIIAGVVAISLMVWIF